MGRLFINTVAFLWDCDTGYFLDGSEGGTYSRDICTRYTLATYNTWRNV